MKVLVAGDFCPRDRVSDLIEKEHYEELFHDVKELIYANDYSIVNFECPVVEHVALPIDKQGPNLKCSQKSVDAIKYAGFNCCTLANNHIADFGDVGVADTLQALKDKQLDYVGGGKNLEEAAQVLYKLINGKTLAIINCCESEFSIAKQINNHVNTCESKRCVGGGNPLNPIKQYYAIIEARSKADKVLVIVHGGHEHYQLPSPRMKELYRFFIDAGADAVINHHQHCYSGYEYYNGGLIVYGLGNFCFDSVSSNKKEKTIWNEGYMVTLDLSTDKTKFEIHPYVQCHITSDVRIMSEHEQLAFNDRINHLNEIILDDDRLDKAHKEYMDSTSRGYLLTLEPYKNRYLKALYVRGLLPSFLSNKKKRLSLQNYLVCESHYERIVHAVVHYDEIRTRFHGQKCK